MAADGGGGGHLPEGVYSRARWIGKVFWSANKTRGHPSPSADL